MLRATVRESRRGRRHGDATSTSSRASLRADTTDLVAYVEALAVKLEGALPGRARIARGGGGLFGRGRKRVETIEIDLGESRYLLDQRRHRARRRPPARRSCGGSR